MAQRQTTPCDLEQELKIELPAARDLPPDVRSDFLVVVRTALQRERVKARADMDTKLAGRSAVTRFAVRTTVLGRHK
jgi:hypothetical protein